jgi:hypothetical protein
VFATIRLIAVGVKVLIVLARVMTFATKVYFVVAARMLAISPRAAILVYSLAWLVASPPIWVPALGPLNIVLVALNPLSWVVMAHLIDYQARKQLRGPRAAEEDTDMDDRVAVWEQLVAAPSGTWGDEAPLLGSQVHPLPRDLVEADVLPGGDPERPVGFQLLIVGRTVRQHARVIAGKQESIAAAYRTRPDAVSFLPRGDHSEVVVQVLDPGWMTEQDEILAHRMAASCPWQGPTLDPATGLIGMGIDVTTGLPVHAALFRPGQGIRHWWFVGETGSGKSNGLSSMLVSACSAGIVVPHIIDMQGGVSLSEWQDVVPEGSWAEDAEQAIPLLARLDAKRQQREAWMKANRVKCMTPSRDTPIHLVIVEEAPELANDVEAMRYLDRLARLTRKCLIAVVWVSQMGQASKAFGIAGVPMRSQIMAGNVQAYKADAFTAGKVTQGGGGIRVDAMAIPADCPGLAYAVGPASPVPSLHKGWDFRGITDVTPWIDLPTDPLPASTRQAAPALSLVAEPAADGRRSQCGVTLAEWFGTRDPGIEIRTGEVLTAWVGKTSTTFSRSTVMATLAELAKDGTIRDRGYGKWMPASQ